MIRRVWDWLEWEWTLTVLGDWRRAPWWLVIVPLEILVALIGLVWEPPRNAPP